jgi:hypothetical protein
MKDRSYIVAGLFGAMAATGAWCSYEVIPAPELLRDVADSLAGITGTLAGFLLTCVSIVVAVTPTQVAMQELKRIGALARLVRRSGVSVMALVLASIVAAVTRLAEGEALQVLVSATAVLTVFGLLLMAAAGREYLRIFGYLSSFRSA